MKEGDPNVVEQFFREKEQNFLVIACSAPCTAQKTL